MLIGIIQGIAQLITIEKYTAFQTHTIKMPTELLVDLTTGTSVAHDGCCLMVTKIQSDLVSFNVIDETLRVTKLGELVPGDWININFIRQSRLCLKIPAKSILKDFDLHFAYSNPAKPTLSENWSGRASFTGKDPTKSALPEIQL